jgi:hypothetical protein
MDTQFRYGFAGHETFPFRYGWLKKAVDGVARDHAMFSRHDAIVVLGVGKNMVQSIHHWGLATQVLSLGEDRILRVTQLGRLLFQEWDPYLEDPASLWLLQWLLVTNPARAAAWHLIFTRYPQPDFTKAALIEFLASLVAHDGMKVRPATLARDIDCFIRTYVPAHTSDRSLPEDTFDCPLAELGLIQRRQDGESYRFTIGARPSLPVDMLGYALLDFWRREGRDRQTLAVSECLYGIGGPGYHQRSISSPGQAFKLDENAMVEYLEALERLTAGDVALDETAGLKQVYRRRDVEPLELLRNYYTRSLTTGRRA